MLESSFADSSQEDMGGDEDNDGDNDGSILVESR